MRCLEAIVYIYTVVLVGKGCDLMDEDEMYLVVDNEKLRIVRRWIEIHGITYTTELCK
jgi:hypothetical protein